MDSPRNMKLLCTAGWLNVIFSPLLVSPVTVRSCRTRCQEMQLAE